MVRIAQRKKKFHQDSAEKTTSVQRTAKETMFQRLGKVFDYVKDQDIFGQPIPLNYDGDDTFKTLPGGILSVVLLFFIVAYTSLKFNAMIRHEDWSLTQQQVITPDDELSRPLNLSNSKFSVALEFEPGDKEWVN